MLVLNGNHSGNHITQRKWITHAMTKAMWPLWVVYSKGHICYRAMDWRGTYSLLWMALWFLVISSSPLMYNQTAMWPGCPLLVVILYRKEQWRADTWITMGFLNPSTLWVRRVSGVVQCMVITTHLLARDTLNISACTSLPKWTYWYSIEHEQLSMDVLMRCITIKPWFHEHFICDCAQPGKKTWPNVKATSRYSDVIMIAMASQITSLTIVYSTVYSGADQRKHQSSASLAFVRGIHRRPVNSPHKWPVTSKMFPFDDVIVDKLTDISHTATENDTEESATLLKWGAFPIYWYIAAFRDNDFPLD